MTDEIRLPPKVVADMVGVWLLREVPNVAYTQTNAAIVEWQDGDHTHLAFEVMDSTGSWRPLAAVSLQDCLAAGVCTKLRQFPILRLVWLGQIGEVSLRPQRLVPEGALKSQEMNDDVFENDRARRAGQLLADVVEANTADLYTYWRDKQAVAEANLLILKARGIQARAASSS